MSWNRKISKFIAKLFFKVTSFFVISQNKKLKTSLEEFWEYLQSQLEKSQEVRFQAQNRRMVENIFDLQNTIVREIMVPRTDLAVVRVSDSIDKAISVIRERGRSRIPVFQDKIDNIIGILYAKDILRHTAGNSGKDTSLEKLMRPAYFVPETKNVFDLLQELRLKRIHLAIVIDEYGGTAGIVTMEDVIEEIIGEVQDEYDTEEARVVQIDPVTWKVDAKLSLEDLDDSLKIQLPKEEDYDTLAGFILYKLGKIPEHREKIEHDGYTFIVVESNEKSIEKVKIIKKKTVEEKPPTGATNG